MTFPKNEPIPDESETETIHLLGNNSEYAQNLLIEHFARIMKAQMLLYVLYGRRYIYYN